MRYIRALGFRLSLLLIWLAQAIRYAQFKLSPNGGEVRGVRIILVRDRKVVLVSHWYAPWAWTLPGGGVSKKESPETAAMREAYEETGFKVTSLAGVIGTYNGTWGMGDRVRVFYTGDFEGSLELKPNMEIMARSWFDIDDLPDEISPGNRRRVEAYRDGVRDEEGKHW